MVNRETILEQLTQAERQIGISECAAARLRQDLTRLKLSGDAAMDARQALKACEELQAEHRAERTRLLAELSASRVGVAC